MLMANSKRLAEMHSDMKEVGKATGEAVINIRKLKQKGQTQIKT